MLKAIGIFTLIAVCTLGGFKLSDGIKARHKKLCDYCILLSELADRIRTGTELFEILKGEKARELVVIDGFNMTASKGCLTQKDRSIIDEFFQKVGLLDKQGEIDRCNTYLELLKRQEEEAEKEVKTKAGLYNKLGLFAGLFIAVILV